MEDEGYGFFVCSEELGQKTNGVRTTRRKGRQLTTMLASRDEECKLQWYFSFNEFSEDFHTKVMCVTADRFST
jgi:hypothetical protein